MRRICGAGVAPARWFDALNSLATDRRIWATPQRPRAGAHSYRASARWWFMPTPLDFDVKLLPLYHQCDTTWQQGERHDAATCPLPRLRTPSSFLFVRVSPRYRHALSFYLWPLFMGCHSCLLCLEEQRLGRGGTH